MKKIILLIFTLLITTSCKTENDNNHHHNKEFEINESAIKELNELLASGEEPQCISDCPGIQNIDPLKNGFCIWLTSNINNECTSDCSTLIGNALIELEKLCQNSADDESFKQTLFDLTLEGLSSQEFQNLTDVMVIELLVPNKKIKSISYNNRQEAEKNKSIFAIANSTNQKIKLDWIDFNGNLQSKGYINAKDIREHNSFNGHAFQLSNAKTNEILNHFIVPKDKGIVIIK